MAKAKKKPAESTGLESIIARIDRIKILEGEMIDLKRQLLVDSASRMKSNGSSNLSFLLLGTSGKTLAAPLSHVEEVVEMPELVEIPKPVASIAGMVNYHGELVAVIDMDELAGTRSLESALSQVLVICVIEGRRFALKVDEALEVVTLNPEDVTMTDTVLPGIIQSSGVIRLEENKTALVIDLVWIAVGAHLGAVLSEDAAKPLEP